MQLHSTKETITKTTVDLTDDDVAWAIRKFVQASFSNIPNTAMVEFDISPQGGFRGATLAFNHKQVQNA